MTAVGFQFHTPSNRGRTSQRNFARMRDLIYRASYSRGNHLDCREVSLLLIGLGVALFVCGIVIVTLQPAWWSRLSEYRYRRRGPSPTLEPRKPGAGFGLAANWPGLLMIAAGVILMLAGSAV